MSYRICRSHIINTLLLAACGLVVACGGSGGGDSAPATGASASASSVAAVAGGSHNAGLDCLGCHKAGGTGKGIFTLAGTIYKSSGAAQTNAKVNMYTHNTGTVAISLSTDANGNFYTSQTVAGMCASGICVAGGPLVTGVDANVHSMTTGGDRNMTGIVTAGGCNGCHGVSVTKITAD